MRPVPVTITLALLCFLVFAQRELPLDLRLCNALDSYAVYLVQAVWPSDLSVFYPHPGEAVSRGRAALAEQRGEASTAREIRARINLYRARRAWVEPAREPALR